MQFGILRAAVANRDFDQDVRRCFLGVLYKDIEIAVLRENAGIEQLIFKFVASSLPVRLNQVGIGIGGLRILVEVLHVGVGQRRIEIEIVLLHILPVIAFAVGKPEQALLQNWILAIP